MTQASLWQQSQHSSQFAELCNALYERELLLLANTKLDNAEALKSRMQSLPYYVQKAAHAMVSKESPLTLDTQNATWSTKQSRAMPLAGQSLEDVAHWYNANTLQMGLVVPVKSGERIMLDCIDRIDSETKRFRTNCHGWFVVDELIAENTGLLKPTKKVMMASCAGHAWNEKGPCQPVMPSLRELLLSCSINWQNLKKPVPAHYPHN